MARSPQTSVTLADLRGGRNGADPPLSLPDNQAVEMLNVDNYTGLLANKRGGASAVTETGGTAFSLGIQSLFRHVPGADETAAEFWGFDGAGIAKRMTGGTSFANVTLEDAISTNYQNVSAASLNGKLFLAFDSAQDLLHVYDPNLSSPKVRRVGVTKPAAAPTAANTAVAGTYAATLRYYRVRWIIKHSTVIDARSEPSASVSITPDGSHTGITVTMPASPDSNATHWELEVSLDNTTFYLFATTVIGTTTSTDTTVTTSYSTGTLSADTGEYTRWTSVKYLLTDGNRLLGAGSWESGKTSRVFFSPVLGTTDEGDDERVPDTTAGQQNWVDLNENDGGAITGLGGPVYGAAYAFKYRQIWKLNPTGDNLIPYLPRKLSDTFGCIAHKSIVSARDAQGNPALYFLSSDGPCRIVISGGSAVPQYLGRDVEDIWAGINLAASTTVAHGIYHSDKHQVWFWIATGSSADPDTKLVFDVLLGKFTEGDRVRGGWYKHTGSSAAARCSVMMSNTLGATMSRDLKPYIGRASGTVIWKCDTTDTDDAGNAFQAYAKSKPLLVAPIGQNVGIGQSILVAKALSGCTITQTLDRDYGLETRTSTALLTASAAGETRVIKKFEASDLSQAGAVQVQLGDAAAIASGAWALDALMIPVISQEVR
jgi:hypothetical protein